MDGVSTMAEMERVKMLHLTCVWRCQQVQCGRVERAESSLWLTQDFCPPVESLRIEDCESRRTSLNSESKCLVGPECPREQRECLSCPPHDNRPSGESAVTGQTSQPSPVHTQWKKHMWIYSLYTNMCDSVCKFYLPDYFMQDVFGIWNLNFSLAPSLSCYDHPFYRNCGNFSIRHFPRHRATSSFHLETQILL